MSNQNTGDKPQITANWRIRRFNEEHEDAPFFVEADLPSAKQNGHYPTVEVLQEDYGNHNGYTHEIRLADAELMVLACNLSQKYGSLEAMEQQLLGLKVQHHNDILLAQAASDKLIEAEDWKIGAMQLLDKWNLVDEYVRNHPSVKFGDSVSEKALSLLIEAEKRVKFLHKIATDDSILISESLSKEVKQLLTPKQ